MTEQKVQRITLEKSTIPFDQFYQLSDKDKAYQGGDPRLKPFFRYEPQLSNFEKVIQDKKRQDIDRGLLYDVLQAQYTQFNVSQETKHNIELIKQDNTFTLITAHQPSLFTGPLYYIYKICSVIHLAKQLNAAYPTYHFLPLFISGAEDHDFEEISKARIYGKDLLWNNDEGGPVGQLSTSTLNHVIEELFDVLGDNEFAERLKRIFNESYQNFDHYGVAVQNLVNELFKKFGLIVLNMSDPKLKRAFIPIMKKEIFESASIGPVSQTVEALEKAGFSQQAHIREINFFYLGKGFRKRIVKENGKFQIVDSNISFTEAALHDEIEKHPERFSPNVIMRPVYQEFTLPNLAYIGGGGELAYWLERKSQFDLFKVNYPMLIRRNSVLWIEQASRSKMEKLGLDIQDLLQHPHDLVKLFLNRNAEVEINLENEKKEFSALFEQLKSKAMSVDKSLEGKVAADQANLIKSLDKIEQRLKKAEKNKHEVGLRQLSKLQDKLFPTESLQERKDNFIPFYLKHGEAFFEYLVEELNPLEKEFIVISEG